MVHPGISCDIVSGIVLHVLQMSLLVVLWMFFFISLVVIAGSCMATVVASVPPFSLAPFIHSKVASYLYDCVLSFVGIDHEVALLSTFPSVC